MPALSVRAIIETFASVDAKADLNGGSESLDRLVYGANIVSTMEDLDRQRPNSLVIVPQHVAVSGDIALDLLLRRAAATRISCIVVDAGQTTIPTATAELAANFNIALWREPRLDPLELLSRVENLVRSPELVGAGVIRSVSESMATPAGDLGDVVRRLADLLGFPVALLGPDGSIIISANFTVTEELHSNLSAIDTGVKDLVIALGSSERILIAPAFPMAANPLPYWLAVQVPSGLDSRSSHVFTTMRITSIALSMNLTQTTLAFERDNRQVSALLDEILSRADRLSVSDVERATALGWQLFGWHVAVQVSIGQSFTTLLEATLSQSLMTALRANGIDARPVGRGRTFIFWTTRATAPNSAEYSTLTSTVQRALAGVERSFPGVRLRAGIGEPRRGAQGIAQSLADAGLALAFAEAGRSDAVLQRSDSMTAERLLNSWLPEGVTRDAIAEIIAPLQRADTEGHLVATLSTYLDVESNTSETASRLHVHRNTVLQRLQRIRELLTLSLDDPNDRLALQMALRIQKSS